MTWTVVTPILDKTGTPLSFAIQADGAETDAGALVFSRDGLLAQAFAPGEWRTCTLTDDR